MTSLFSNISGRTGEDIATEIVAYLLSTQTSNVPFQKLFFHRVLGKAVSSSELQIQISTQPSFEVGRPDCILWSKDTLILIETKLGAYLSGDNQLLKYCHIFSGNKILKKYFPLASLDNSYRNKVLVLLAPQSTILLSESVSNRKCQKLYNKLFIEWCSDQNILYLPISWEVLMSDLDEKDSIQNELLIYVTSFVNQELSLEEKMILKDSNVPRALNKIFNIISYIRNYLMSKDIKTGRMSQSYNYYGFDIEMEKFTCWFGYSLPTWENYQTPIFLQIRQDWINKKEVSLTNKFPDLGFKYDDDLEYLFPFSIDSIGSWKEDLVKLLNKID
jgi:hypothetical protein